jgi:O-antigen/teichoic acid export membrane protein
LSQETTERRFLHSTVASYASLFVRLVVGFLARVLLARLISDENHGLYELALRIVIIASAFRDLGLSHQLIRDARRPYGTVLAFTLATGSLLTAALVVSAPVFGFLDPRLPDVLRVFAVWVLLDALIVVPRTFFERELRIGRLMFPEVLRGLTTAIISLALASNGWGVWSFVYGELAATALFAALVWWRAWGKLPAAVHPRILPELLRQSGFLFVIWVTLQLVTYVDIYIIEIFGTTAIVGQYSRAYWIAFLVPLIVAPRALLPALVAYRDVPERFLGAFRLGTAFLMSFQVTAGYFLFFNAHKVVAILLGPDWKPAIPLLQVLCFVPFLDVFTDIGGEVLKVRHEDRTWLVTAVLNLVSLVGFGTWFTYRWGAYGMAWANFLLLGNALMAWRMSRIFGAGFGLLMRDLALVYLAPLPLFLAAAEVFPPDSWSRFAASGAAAAVSGAVLAAKFYRPYREFFGRSAVPPPPVAS